MKKLIQLLMSLGKVTTAKTGRGYFIYNPNTFDLPSLTALADAQSFVVIHTQTPSPNGSGGWLPPKLFVGPAKTAMTEEQLIAEAMKWKD